MDTMLWHIVHGREFVWTEVHWCLLGRLNGNPAGYLHDAAITSSAEVSRSVHVQGLQASLMHFVGPILGYGKRFDNDMHAWLTADAYGVSVVLVIHTYGVVVQAPSSL